MPTRAARATSTACGRGVRQTGCPPGRRGASPLRGSPQFPVWAADPFLLILKVETPRSPSRQRHSGLATGKRVVIAVQHFVAFNINLLFFGVLTVFEAPKLKCTCSIVILGKFCVR